MTRDENTSSRQAWSNYWSSGALHSCAGSFAGNYGGCIAEFWARLLPEIAAGQRMLDLATGNGALPRLVSEALPADALLQIDAVDLAHIAPTWSNPDSERRIRFHAGVGMEHLPFDTAAFDWVTSQFGIEYADEDAAVREVLRVSRPDAGLVFVMHHADSLLARVAAAEVRHVDRLLDDGGILAAAERALPWIGAAKAGRKIDSEMAAIAARESYNRAVQALQVEIESAIAPDLLAQALRELPMVLGSVRGTDVTAQLQSLERWRKALEGSRQRSADLVACARSKAGVEAFIARFRLARPQVVVSVEQLRQAEGLLGWGIVLH